MQYSFANTPLKAAQPPLAIARRSHAGCVFMKDMVGCVATVLWGGMVGVGVVICKVPASAALPSRQMVMQHVRMEKIKSHSSHRSRIKKAVGVRIWILKVEG